VKRLALMIPGKTWIASIAVGLAVVVAAVSAAPPSANANALGFHPAASITLPSETSTWAMLAADDDDKDKVDYEEKIGGSGGRNLAMMLNFTDNRLRTRAAIQLNGIADRTVEVDNLGLAHSTCTDCQTYAVALQLNLISRNATSVTPQNLAVAMNVGCTDCRTVGRALQYVISVDEPTEVPSRVRSLVQKMDRELHDVQNEPDITVEELEARINAVIDEFKDLAGGLSDLRDEKRKDD
jgi:hypothetical protein